jgi:hypothetical protein
LADAFPMQAGQIVIVPFSATNRLGLESAEAVLGAWLAQDQGEVARAEPSRVAANENAGKEKAPRTRGVPRGPKRPSRG